MYLVGYQLSATVGGSSLVFISLPILCPLCRFTAEEKAKRHPCAYFPFGLGPRNCVGMRFALMEAKMALIEIVRKFRIETKVRISGLIAVIPSF